MLRYLFGCRSCCIFNIPLAIILTSRIIISIPCSNFQIVLDANAEGVACTCVALLARHVWGNCNAECSVEAAAGRWASVCCYARPAGNSGDLCSRPAGSLQVTAEAQHTQGVVVTFAWAIALQRLENLLVRVIHSFGVDCDTGI